MLEINRRSLLTAMGATAFTSMLPGTTLAATRRNFFERVGLPIGLQIYTLGPDAGKDIDATFAQVARIGYREIELPALLGRQPAELAAAAKRAGLTIGSIHLPLLGMGGPAGLSMTSDPARIADDLGTLGARWAVAPIMLIPGDFRPQPGETMEAAISRTVAAAGEDIWKKTAATLNEKASALKPLGIKVGYHNHNVEFAPIGKTTGWDILWKETDPDLVKFEVDVGWIATAGLDPIAFLKRAAGRVSLLHVKDVAVGNPQSFRISMKPAEVGSGTLPWDKLLPAAYRAGVRHFLVEQEPPFVIPRIEAAIRSYAFLSKLKA
ncbi:xylose isomerase [Novosphingobium endophyticum]|uniref:Xylose isomerase n=1 Tax=Novosphingobium endophyticum TaxID=1955250 RepID=A0A916X5I6_9SPHN|nr:sugar phosphate isomerase/epimerase [Novosphingobium endophyticum]GGC00903.1 xylose isomerase [Novosphingobium endophyticum]